MDAEPQILSLTPDDALAFLRTKAAELLARPGRHVMGIAGGPGVGKSTLATRLVRALGGVAAYIPMDGFHMRHAQLEARGTVADKGMPHTFDGAAFVTFLSTLKSATDAVSGPGYSRQIEDVVDDAYTVAATARLLIVEGNYLLVSTAPWWRVRPLLDLAVFIDVPRDVVAARLLKRHAEAGLFTEARNRAHVARVDMPNYDLVQRSRGRADIALDLIVDA